MLLRRLRPSSLYPGHHGILPSVEVIYDRVIFAYRSPVPHTVFLTVNAVREMRSGHEIPVRFLAFLNVVVMELK